MTRAVPIALWVLALLSGCADHYVRGRQTRAYFVEQRVNPRGVSGAPAGLDSEDASLIHARYRATMAPDEAPAASDRGADVLVIEESGSNRRTVQEVSRERNRERSR